MLIKEIVCVSCSCSSRVLRKSLTRRTVATHENYFCTCVHNVTRHTRLINDLYELQNKEQNFCFSLVILTWKVIRGALISTLILTSTLTFNLTSTLPLTMNLTLTLTSTLNFGLTLAVTLTLFSTLLLALTLTVTLTNAYRNGKLELTLTMTLVMNWP